MGINSALPATLVQLFLPLMQKLEDEKMMRKKGPRVVGRWLLRLKGGPGGCRKTTQGQKPCRG